MNWFDFQFDDWLDEPSSYQLQLVIDIFNPFLMKIKKH